MPKYVIERWDAVIPDKNTFPMPMIYIKPNRDFVDYAKSNNWEIVVQISDTNSIYDGKTMAGVIDSSGYFPNYRPNFYNDTGMFVITLFAQWKGYPPKNGSALIRGLEGPDKIIPKPQPFKVPTPVAIEELYSHDNHDSYDHKNKNSRLTTSQIALIALTILVIFGVLLFISCKRNE